MTNDKPALTMFSCGEHMFLASFGKDNPECPHCALALLRAGLGMFDIPTTGNPVLFTSATVSDVPPEAGAKESGSGRGRGTPEDDAPLLK